MTKVVTVFGASGNQGGSVARALARDSQFKVRAVARNPDCKGLQELRGFGNVEIVRADIDDKHSIECALKGAYGVFIVTPTDYNDPGSVEKEIRRGMSVAEACVNHPTLNHVIYSTQLSPRKTLGLEARQCDAKAETDMRMRKLNLPMTAVEIPFNYERVLEDFTPERMDDSNFRLFIPVGGRMDCIAREDVGEIVRRIFTQPEYYLNKTIAISGDKLSISDMAEIMTRTVSYEGKRIFNRQMTHVEFRDLPIKGAKDQANHFEFLSRVDQRFNVMATREIHQYVQTFSDWCRENRNRIQQMCSPNNHYH